MKNEEIKYVVLIPEHTLRHCGAEGQGSTIGESILHLCSSKENAEEMLEIERDKIEDNDFCSNCNGWTGTTPDLSLLKIEKWTIKKEDI